MNRFLGFGLALSLALGFCVAAVLARGGHGGGHGGHHGGHHSGHHGHADHHSAHHHSSHHHSSHHAHHHSHWSHHNRPFSHDWYAHHRGAWGGGWGWGNPWRTATWGAAAAWLGLSAAEPIWGGYGPTNTVVYDTDNELLNAAAPEPEGANLSAEALASQTAAAHSLAGENAADNEPNESFLPLGVFTLAPENQTEATAMLQLAVSKQGALRGTYYDLLADTEQPIRGSVDKPSQRVAWTVGSQGKIAFQTALPVLTEASGPVSVHYENGQTRQWVIARYAQEPSESGSQDDESGTPEEADATAGG